jgi:hypothetical protein
VTPPVLSPAARLVLLAIDETATVDEVAAILVREQVVPADRAPARAAAVLEHLDANGALTTRDERTWTVTPRGERFRDWLLRELADDGKRPAKAPDAPTPRPSRSKPPRRASAPKAATPEASADDRITFTTPNGWVVHLNPFRQEKARGGK